MAVLDLITVPNPILTQKCSPITTFDSNLNEFINDMYDTMNEHQGIGLAAPQVGILEQICICEYENNFLALINPVIIKKTDPLISEEGCLSIPGKLVEVPRYKEIEIKAQDVEGKEFSCNAGGMLAIIIQHELDHLDGKLITNIGKIIKEV